MSADLYVEEQYVAPWLMPCTCRELEIILQAMLDAQAPVDVGDPVTGLELYLVDDAEISRMNEEHMDCMGPTNILSFPGGRDLAGTLLLSLDTLDRECRLYGQDRWEHCIRLLAHGLAHLKGLEHGPEHDRVSALCAEEGLACLAHLRTGSRRSI